MRRARRAPTSADDHTRAELHTLARDTDRLLARRRVGLLLLLAIVLLAVAGTGCSQQRLARRCATLYPAQVIERRDTTVLAGGLKTDTLTVHTLERDTVVLDTGRVRVVVVRQRDTLRIAAECRPDTIRLPGIIETRVRTIEVQPPWWNRWYVGALGLLLLAVLLPNKVTHR